MRTTTLGELGAQLPIGVPAGKTLNKEFKLRPYKSRVDRHLGTWVEVNTSKYSAGQLLACKVAKFMSLIVESWGGQALPLSDDGDSPPEQENKVFAWYYADVLYAYIYERTRLDPRLPVDFKCPRCKHQEVINFDLRQVEVVTIEEPDELSKWIALKEPFQLRDGTICRKVKVQPPPWSVLTKPGVMSGNLGVIAFASLQEAICAVNNSDKGYHMVQSELDEIDKMDSIRINHEQILTAGVEIATPVDCPKDGCSGRIEDALDWSFDYFFGTSLQILET